MPSSLSGRKHGNAPRAGQAAPRFRTSAQSCLQGRKIVLCFAGIRMYQITIPSYLPQLFMKPSKSSRGVGRSHGLFLASLFWLLVLAQQASGNAENDEPSQKCSIYMAPSTLKGHAGFGVFTTRDIAPNQPILSGPPGTPDGPTIAVVNSLRNSPLHLMPATYQLHNSFGHYWWGRGVPDHVALESDSGDSLDYQITFGALPNHHCVLSSIDHEYPPDPYDDSLLNRYTDPGAGAFSYHRGRVFKATRHVSAGSELFLSYGYCQRIDPGSDTDSFLWYPTWARDLPMREHYWDATRTLRVVWDSLIEEFGSVENLPDDLILEGAPDLEPQLTKLIPGTTRVLKEIMKNPMARISADIFQRTLAEKMLIEPRTVEWIRENGMCVENLIPGKSAIQQAGQGGFAQFPIRKGEIVVPAPLLQITNRAALTIHDDGEKPTGTQLLLNYCFGHHDTTMLLCPDTNAILVNHCSDRTKECGPNGPNAKFQWASGWDPDTPTWMNMTVDQISKEDGRGLSLEIVALRDIAPGEEVFMDYGAEWEKAWSDHVKGWTAPDGSDEYKSVKELNNDPRALDMFVSHNLRIEKEHPSLFTACVYYPTEFDEHEVWETTDRVESMSHTDLLQTFSDDGSFYVQDYLTHGDGAYWPCAVLLEERDGTPNEDPPPSYTVRIMQRENSDYGEMKWATNSIPRFLTKFPRESIRIFPKPLHSDQFLKGAFRHHIPLRDDMVPEAWKNKKGGVRRTKRKVIVHWVEPPEYEMEEEDDEEDDDDE